MRQPVSHAKHNETHMSELLNRRQRLRKRKKRNIILNTVCILLVLCAIVWTVDYFWRYFKYETTNDAVIDQYISPVGIRVSGYIKEVRFTEHQPVKAGDTLLVLDDREYRIRSEDKWVTANYKETQIARIFIGQKVRIRVDALGDKTFHGTVTAISEATGSKYSLVPTDNSAGNFVKVQQRIPVRIDFDDVSPEEMQLLRAGMMVETEAKIR